MNNRRIFQISAVVFASAALLAGCGGGGGTPARSGSQVQVTPAPSGTPSGSTVRYGAVYSYYDSNGNKIFNWRNQRNTAQSAQDYALSYCREGDGSSSRSRCEPVTTFTNCVAIAWSGNFLVRTYATGNTETLAKDAAKAECSRRGGSSCQVTDGNARCNNPVTTQTAKSGWINNSSPAPSGSNVRYGAVYSYYSNGRKYFAGRNQRNTAAEIERVALSYCEGVSGRSRCEPVTTFTNCVAIAWSDNFLVRAYGTGNTKTLAKSAAEAACSQERGSGCSSSSGLCNSPVTTQASKSGGHNNSSAAPSGSNVRYGAVYSYYSNGRKYFSWQNQRSTAAEIQSSALSYCRGVSGRSDCEPVTTFTNCVALGRSGDGSVRTYATGDTLDRARTSAVAECSRLRGSSCEASSGNARCNNPVTTQASKSEGIRDVRYGAIFTGFGSNESRGIGYGIRYNTEREASDAARSGCMRSLSRCVIEDTFTNCVAIAQDNRNGIGAYATDDTLDRARTSALAECSRLRGSSCEIASGKAQCNNPVTSQVSKTGGFNIETPSAPSRSNVRYGAVYSYSASGTRGLGARSQSSTQEAARRAALSQCSGGSGRTDCDFVTTFTNCVAIARSGDGSVLAYGTGDTRSNARSSAEIRCSRLRGSSCSAGSDTICNDPVTSQISKSGGITNTQSPPPSPPPSPSPPSGSNVRYGAVFSYYLNGNSKNFGSRLQSSTQEAARSNALSYCMSDSRRTGCDFVTTFTNCSALANSGDGSVRTYATGNSRSSARLSAVTLCSQRGGSSCSAGSSGVCTNPVTSQASKSGVIGGTTGFVLLHSSGIYEVMIRTRAAAENHCRRVGCRIVDTFTNCAAAANNLLHIGRSFIGGSLRSRYATGASPAIAASTALHNCGNSECNITSTSCY